MAIFAAAAFGVLVPSISTPATTLHERRRFHYPQWWREACEEKSGHKAAKEVMKGAVKKAKADGKDVNAT